MPVYSLGAWAIDESSPPDPVLRHGDHKVLLTLSDHFTFTIPRRHLFTNVSILFAVCLVILHVSELYNRIDLTL